MIYLILGLGFGLRLIGLNQSFWLDETIQVWASRLPIDQFFNQFLPTDFNPPGYYLITRQWINLFGEGEAVIRLTSVVFGVGSIYLVYLILKKLVITNYQLLITILLLSTSPLHIYYSQEARMYSMAVFSVLASVLLVIKFVENNSWLHGLLVGFGFILMAMSHYLTLLTLPVFLGYLGYKQKLFNRKSAVIILILVLFSAVYLPVFRSQLTVGSGLKEQAPVWHQIIGSPSLKSALLLPIKFVIGRVSIRPQWLYGLTSVILVPLFWGIAGLEVKEKNKYIGLFAGLLLFPPALGFLISFWLPVFSYFRFVFCLPFLYLLIGLSPVTDKIKYGLVIINLIFTGIYLFNPGFHRENWRGLSEWLNNQDKPPVYILNQFKIPLDYYYDGKICSLNHYNDSNDCSVDGKVYLVSYGLPIFDREDRIREKLKAEGLRQKAGESFRKVGIEVWEVSN